MNLDLLFNLIFVFGLYFIFAGLLYLRGINKIIDPSLILFYLFVKIVWSNEKVINHKEYFFKEENIKKYSWWIIVGGAIWIIMSLLFRKIFVKS